MTSILIADDHAMVRSAFRLLLEHEESLHVVGEADNGEDAFRKYFELRPDVVLLDLLMPGEGGLATTRRILSRDANAKVLILSMFDEPGIVRRALEVGATGYISKGAVPAELVVAVKAIAAGESYVEERLRPMLNDPDINGHPVDLLTTREFEVFSMLAIGRSVIEIAAMLHLSTKTVGAHRTSIMKKLGLRNSAELARMAIVWHVVKVPSHI